MRSSRLLKRLFAGGCVFISGAVASAACATDFDRGRNVSVMERLAAANPQDGAPVGPFRLFGTLEADGLYDSNIFATQTRRTDGFVTVLRPDFQLKSNFGNHELNASGSAAVSRYADQGGEDSAAWMLSTDGRLDVRRNWSVFGRVEHRVDVELRSDPSTPINAAQSSTFDVQSETLGTRASLNRLRLSAVFQRDDYSFGTVRLSNGQRLDQRYRNEGDSSLSGLTEYAISPDTALFASFAYNRRDFDVGRFPSVPDERSQGINAQVGANLDLTKLLRGEVSVGYLTQTFDSPRLASLHGVSAWANVSYFIRPWVTMRFGTRREVRNSGLIGAPSYLATDLEFRSDFELRRNVVLSAGVAGGWDDFKSIDRHDDRLTLLAEARYVLNRRVSLGLTYHRLELSSQGTGAGPGYNIDQVRVSLTYAR